MSELVFACIGALVSVLALVCLIVFLINRSKKNKYDRQFKSVQQKIERYDELAHQIKAQSDIILKDEWGDWRWKKYDFEKLTKEFIELRRFKEEHEKTSK